MAPGKLFLVIAGALAAVTASVDATQYVQRGPRLSSHRDASETFATSIAISADGKTLACGSTTGKGRTDIYKRVGNEWVRQRPTLVGTGASKSAAQGFSVALSLNANTLAVGAPSDVDGRGAVWVFVRSGANWQQQGPKLVGDGVGRSFAEQGFSVALSANGDTLAVGGPSAKRGVGAVWVFKRDAAGSWKQQGPLLSKGTGFTRFGTSVSLAGDGRTLAVGAEQAGNGVGATWVFTRNLRGVWAQQGPRLVGSGVRGKAQQGTSVSLSRDGSKLAVGGPYDNVHIDPVTGEILFDGAVWVFTRSGARWSQQGGKLVGAGSERGANQGYAVALSDDGKTLVSGAPGLPSGRTFVFTHAPSGKWRQSGGPLIGEKPQFGARQGNSVAVSADGRMVVSATPKMRGNAAGAVWVFARRGAGN